LGFPEAELSVLIVDDPQITALNHQYLQRQGPTNVIAFPMQEGKFADVSPHLLGDVVISADTAAREGTQGGMSMEVRLIELLVHGVLHLCGYDHEQDRAQALEMEIKSRQILGQIGTASPSG
jgi:probable rRNA maturation factor